MSAEETAAETIKKLEFQLAAAEEMMEMQKNAAQKNTAKTMRGVQVLENLVGELHAENQAAKMLVDRLTEELRAEKATSSLLRTENQQLWKAKRRTEAKNHVKARSIECQCSDRRLELRTAMRSSWLKFRLVMTSWKCMAMRSKWPKLRLVMRSWKRVVAITSSSLKLKLVISSWVLMARKQPVSWPDTDNEFD